MENQAQNQNPLASFPPWARELRRIFRGATVSQYILHGNIRDLVPCAGSKSGEGPDAGGRTVSGLRFLPMREYLSQVLFAPFDVVLSYDRGHGVEVLKGGKHFQRFLTMVRRYHAAPAGSLDWNELPGSLPVSGAEEPAVSLSGGLPRGPVKALDLLDRFLDGVMHFSRLSRESKGDFPRSAAVLVDYAHLLVPRSESLHFAGELGSHLIRLLHWAEDPGIQGDRVVTVLLTENLLDLNERLVESPYSAKIHVDLPDAEEAAAYADGLLQEESGIDLESGLDAASVGLKLSGLSRVNVRHILLQAARNRETVDSQFLSRARKGAIEKEAHGKLEFLESTRTLDDVAGHAAAKAWLREDAQLLRRGAVQALPMGYLLAGRIGTGKTYLVQCFAGECGVPFVELKNFRDKWVGATEGNLEKVFRILRALGQVVVFVDEADQMTGKRDSGSGDSGLSGRVYGMLAKEMSRTENRGRILWIFATSRPDLVEVDLKRQGRLDVHIPLFPPETPEEKRDMFVAMARKLRLPLNPEDLPDLPFEGPMGGNEMEGLLVRVVRAHALLPEGDTRTLAQILHETVREFRPSAHAARLDYMDLVAVKECTDTRFLPERFRGLSPEQVDARIEALRGELVG